MSRIACVFGGTGFIGEQVVRLLCKAGYRVKIATRVPEAAYEIKVAGSVGQVVGYPCDYSEDAIARAVQGCDVVVNLVGILYEKKNNSFARLHTDLPAIIARQCAASGARFIHLSALGVDRAESRYARSKKLGEEAVLRFAPEATILRPSIVFGAGDRFFNRFAGMARFMPVLPLIGGKTKFQPVYVGDVAGAIMAAIDDPAAKGRIYELGGPEILTFKAIYRRLFDQTRRPRWLLPLPFGAARLLGRVLGVLPVPPLTADQVENLKTDNVVQSGMAGLRDLGIQPTALDAILPTYLAFYRPGGRFADKQAA